MDKELSDRLDKLETLLKRIEDMVYERYSNSGDQDERQYRERFNEQFQPPRFPDIRGKR